MWPSNFSNRLSAWSQLRQNAQDLDKDQCLQAVNQWWFKAPWTTYYLHWDDRDYWPDPWQLLQDNIYCDLARGLGILYTLTLLDRKDITDAKLVEAGADNLVLVEEEKYTLNWNPDDILNICPDNANVRRIVTQQDILTKIG